VVPLLRRSQPSAAGEGGILGTLGAPLDLATQALASLSNVGGLGAFDTPLIVLWLAASLTILISIVVVQRRVAREARRCPEGVVAGVSVLRTRSFGPAVVGSLKSVILLPEWTDGLEARFRRLAVLHESEHLRARDPQLLFCAILLAALQPWNVALWWQLRRLKKAIELDCDQRIVNSGVEVRSYGDLLLHIASRRRPTPLTALTISSARTFVERRITAMADHKIGSKHLRAALAAFCGVVLFGLGCETPAPMEIEEPDANVQREEIVATKFKFIYVHLQLGVPIDEPFDRLAHGVPLGSAPEKFSLAIPIPDLGEN
jgi:beta-lactamase regulating signal transducer with metallopeptidase domain